MGDGGSNEVELSPKGAVNVVLCPGVVESPSGFSLVEGRKARRLWRWERGRVLDLLQGKAKTSTGRDEMATV